jgi:hypothetical protein
LGDGERITMLGVGPVAVGDVISKVIMIETILPRIGGAPSGSREGKAGMIVGGVRMVGGWGWIGVRVVAYGLCMGSYGRLVVWIIDYTSAVEELCLGSVTGGIV